MPLAAAMTLAGAVSFALAHSPTIVKQQAVVSQNASAYVKARSQTLPGLQGQLQNQMSQSKNFNGQFSVIGASQASVFSQNQASLGTSYVFDGGLSHFLSLVARAQYDQSKADLEHTRQQVTADVAASFFSLAGKEQAVLLDEGDLRYQQALAAIARAKERAGVAAGVDVLSAQAAEEKSRYVLASAQADEQNARELLAQTIGAPLETSFDVPDRIAQPPMPSKPLETLIAVAQTNRADVASAQDALAVARENRRSADTDLFPQIQTYAQIGNQFSPTFAAELHQPRGAAGFYNVGITSTISLPFVDWGARSAKHRDLNEQISAAQTNVQAVQTQTELDVRQAYRAAQTALAQLSSAQDESRYALEAARVARLQYEHGLIALIDVQQREQAALSAQADLYNARIAYANAIVKLRVSLGITTPEQDVSDLG